MSEEKIRVDGRLNGAETLEEAIEALAELGAQLESYAGRGYTLIGKVKAGNASFAKPDPYTVTDRERLSMAFMELESQYHYTAPISISWEADCLHHALIALREKHDDDAPGLAFWHSERDDYAFGFKGYSDQVKKEYESIPSRSGQAKWVHDNIDHITSAEISERLQHNTLVRPLHIFWGGDHNLIVAVLKKHGLNVDENVEDGECIYVYPSTYTEDVEED